MALQAKACGCAIAGSRLSFQGGDTLRHPQLSWTGHALEKPVKYGCRNVQDGSHLWGQFDPYEEWLWSSPHAREQARSSAAVIQIVWDIFIEKCLVGVWKLGSCLSALMLARGLAGLRLEPDCNRPSYFCNEEYMQSQAESISEEMNYQPNIDYFILRDVIQSTQLLSHSATFNVY